MGPSRPDASGRRASPLRAALASTTWGDRALVLALVAGSLAAILAARPAGRGATALVRVRGREVARLSLGEARSTTVRGRIGDAEIVVTRGEVRILRAPCRRKVCVRTGAVSRSGQVIVCVPNDLVVEVAGGEESPFDAILR